MEAVSIMKKFKSLKGKLTFATVILLVITISVNLAISAVLSYTGMERNVEKDLKSVGQASKVAISNSLNAMKERIQLASAMGELNGSGDINDESVARVCSKKESFGYSRLYLVRQSGTILSSEASLNGKNIADTYYFKQASFGKVYLAAPEKNIVGELVVISAAPVSTNRFKGVIIGETNAQTYSNILSTSVVIGQTGNVFLLDKNGVMIANKRPQLVAQRQNFIEMARKDASYASSAEVYKQMIAGKSGVSTYAYETGSRICYYLPIPGTDGWSCGVVAPHQEMLSNFYDIIFWMCLTAVVLIGFGVFFSIKVAKDVSSPIRSCSDRLLLLSQGDLHSPVPVVKAGDETGTLAGATAVLVDELHEIIEDETHLLVSLAEGNFNVVSSSEKYVGDMQPIQISINSIVDSMNAAFRMISQSSKQVADSSEQVSGGSQLLAQGATEQAESASTLSQSLNKLADDIRSNAEDAAQSSEKANKAESELLEGSKEIQGVTEAISGIQVSSKKISNIIKTVEDIAFQTNILALNAAVEAARAGEAGKGFSVVADEVRNLAAKSSQASKETAGLIAEMLDAVAKGRRITDRTRETMLSIVEDTKGIISSVNSISTASQKQADSVMYLTDSVNKITSVIQTNSATAEESAAASETLSSQAVDMQSLVSRFSLRPEENEEPADA